ncbi:MAG: hypothetical protein KY397_01580 [Gemmatimonadetes bacterium]|nr:hypothetical protein [Gemmatimonadota bacterium]
MSHPARAQAPDEGTAWEIAVHVGALRVDDDFDAGRRTAWGPTVGASLALSPDPRVALALEGWRHELEGRTDPLFDPPRGSESPERGAAVWGAGLHLVVLPTGGRRSIGPTLQFGVESVRTDDAEDRSLAFVSGAGVRGRFGGRGIVRVDVRNHFLTVDEDEVDGVETGRDASLWEIRAGIGLRFGGGT